MTSARDRIEGCRVPPYLGVALGRNWVPHWLEYTLLVPSISNKAELNLGRGIGAHIRWLLFEGSDQLTPPVMTHTLTAHSERFDQADEPSVANRPHRQSER